MPDADDLDNLYIDTGARSADEVLRSGVDVLSPIAAERHIMPVGLTDWSGTAVGDRYGAAVLLQIARALHAVSPLATLERGYAIVFDDAGRVLRSVAAAQPGNRLTARLADGELRVKVRDD